MGYFISTQLPTDHRDRPWTNSTIRTCNEDVGGESYEVVSSYLKASFSARRIADQRLVVVAGNEVVDFRQR